MTNERNEVVRRGRAFTLLFTRSPGCSVALWAEVVARVAHRPGPTPAKRQQLSTRWVFQLHPRPAVLEQVRSIASQLSPEQSTREFNLFLLLPREAWSAEVETAFRLDLLEAAVAVALLSANLRLEIIPGNIIVGQVESPPGRIRIPAACLSVLERFQADRPTSCLPGLTSSFSPASAEPCPDQDTCKAVRVGPEPANDIVFGIDQLLHATMARLPDLGHFLETAVSEDSQTRDAEHAADLHLSATARQIVDNVLEQISARTLAREFAQPVFYAQSHHTFSDLTASSYKEFLAALWPFYARLLAGTGSAGVRADDPVVQADCLALLDRAYAEEGGVAAGWSEVRDGLQGGIPLVATKLARQFTKELQAKHVSRVLCEALNPLNWTERVAILRDLMKRLAPHIREDADLSIPERYVEYIEWIARNYVYSLDSIRTRFLAL